MNLTQVRDLLVREEPPLKLLKSASQQYLDAEAPITYWLITLMIVVFIGEIILSTAFGTSSIQVFATGSFKLFPVLAWTFAPLLHQGVMHFLGNVAGLAIFGLPLEKQLPPRRYVAFIIIAGYVSTAFGAAFLAPFTEKGLAFYGTSGVVFALAGFSLIHFAPKSNELDVIEWIALLFGIGAMFTVIMDVFTGPYLHSNWINGGHMSGFITGIVARSVLTDYSSK